MKLNKKNKHHQIKFHLNQTLLNTKLFSLTMQQKLFDMLLQEEEVSWKTLLYDLVKTEQMDPWDINITLLSKKYLKTIKEMQEHDLRISGKIILAAAILLKMKSSHLLEHGISQLDLLINQTEEELDEELDEFTNSSRRRKNMEEYTLIPRNPQARNRKVSVNDLVQALEKAMASKKRILAKTRPVQFKLPAKSVDIMEVINDVYHKISYYAKKEKKLTFTRLLPPKAGKQEKVYTFLPMLHLENQNKVVTTQKKAFDEIQIKLLTKKKVK